jgi:hypothetical protein
MDDAMRTTLRLVPARRTGFKRRALNLDTTMRQRIRAAICSGPEESSGLAKASAYSALQGEGGPNTTAHTAMLH